MKKLIILFSLILSLISLSNCSSPQSDSALTKDKKITTPLRGKGSGCICIKMWLPVCGEDKKTYGNSCEADCAGVKYTQGACEKEQ